MFADFRKLEDGLSLTADVCIIGAGAAGITIATTLAGTPLSVCLLESGGLDYEYATQELYGGQTKGQPWYDAGTRERGDKQAIDELIFSRVRYFGGSTNHWGHGCLPLDDTDLSVRPWIPFSGWPIKKRDIEPYYAQALALCGAPVSNFRDPPRDPLPVDPMKLRYRTAAIGAANFGTAYRAELQQADNVRVLLHANLLEFHANPNASAVEKATFVTLEGKRGTVHARSFVLCCGGIENPRLLLLSNSVVKQGLGNTRDLVGRFFMDHPRGECGRIYQGNFEPLEHQAFFFAPQIERREKTLQAFVRFNQRELGPIPDGIVAVRELEAAFAARTIPPNVGELIKRVILDADDVIRGIYRRETGRDPVLNNYVEFEGQFEQAPNPDSRITLGNEVDRLGQRRTVLDWQFTELDHHTFRSFSLTVAAEIARLGLGRLKLPSWLDPNSTELAQLNGCAHHMGTTRMSDDPSRGVVDRNCRVHDIANLYIGGSSCFPTGGCGFPTFTIVALALRLARHIQQDLARGVASLGKASGMDISKSDRKRAE